MTSAERTSTLLPRFQEFYLELLRCRDEALADPTLPAEQVNQPLADLLERQAESARASIDPVEFEVYREAQYVMAALADDIFLHLDWDGAADWESLESQRFRAHSAGELLFRKLDWLLQHNDAVHVELAEIYLFALTLGFEGKYRLGGDEAGLADYRRRLFVMIYGAEPHLYQDHRPLLELAPPRTVESENVAWLASPRVWIALPAAVVLLWLGISFVLWSHTVQPVKAALRAEAPVSQAGGN